MASNLSNRAEATAVIERLPPALRNMKPWIRPMADIQLDIRKHHNL